MLRCPAVIDGDHPYTECRCPFGADEIVGIQVPHHPAAAMQINDTRRTADRWLIGTNSNTGQLEIDHMQPGGACRGKRPAHIAVGLAQPGDTAVGAVETQGFVDECRHLPGKRVRSHEPGARSGKCVGPHPVGASLLAKRPAHPTSMLTVKPPSRAGSLPQVLHRSDEGQFFRLV
ncbi:hypothetical protein D3C84_771640 [compost metagenome]